jgi:hypothetical protein
MNNFQANLLNIMYRFKEAKSAFESNDANTAAFIDESKKKIGFYDYMASLLSVYVDVSFMLSDRLESYAIVEFRNKNLKRVLCSNVLYLLGNLMTEFDNLHFYSNE